MSDMITDDDEFEPEKATDAKLREALKSEEEEIFKAAFNELYLRQKIPFLAEMLNHSRGEIRELFLYELGSLTAKAKVDHPSEAKPIERNKQK